MASNRKRILDHYDRLAHSYNDIFKKGWLSLVRQQERKVLFNLLDLCPGLEVLDAGCGAGYDAVSLVERGCNVFGVDFSSKMIAELRSKGISGKVAELENMKLEKSFDRIVCSGALEFVSNIHEVFDEFNRHLKENSLGVFLIPKPNLIGRVYQVYHFILHRIKTKLYSKSELVSYLTKSGFNHVEVHNAGLWVYAIKFIK